MNLFKDLAPAIKKETKRVGIFTFSGVVIMWIVFLILHACTHAGRAEKCQKGNE